MIVVEHPPARERVAELDRAGRDGVPLEVVLLAVDVLQLPGLVAVVLLAHEHLDLRGEPQEAGVEVAGDPVPARLGDARRRLGGVVALVLAEQHDLGAVILAAQKPRLVVLGERPPEVGVAVLPALGFKPQRPSGWRLKHTSEPWPWCQERYSSPWGLREPAATFAPTPKLPAADCSRPLEASWLM